MVNLGVALRADRLDYETGQGEYWWLSVLKAFGFEAKEEAPPQDMTWM